MVSAYSVTIFQLFIVIVSAVNKCYDEPGIIECPYNNTKACYNTFYYGRFVFAGCDFTGLVCNQVERKPYCKGKVHIDCCCYTDACNKKTFTPYGVKKCYKKDGKQNECVRNSSTLAYPRHCFNEFDKDNNELIYAGCDIGDQLCGTTNTSTCVEDKIRKKWICCCPNDGCNDKGYHPIPKTVHKCHNINGTEQTCEEKTKACYNMFRNGKLTKAGCALNGTCEGPRKPYCNQSSTNTTTCCCNQERCNVKTFSPKGVKKCYNKYMEEEDCKRNIATLALPEHCYSKFMIRRSDKIRINGGCDNTNNLCGIQNITECIKDGKTKWTCCCPTNDCNIETFSPFGIKKCLTKDGEEENCTRSPSTLSFPSHCYNKFDTENNTWIGAGCDNDNLLCGDKNTTTCYKNKTMNKWICCCPKDDCNNKTFTPHGVEWCYGKYGGTIKCKRNRTSLALPTHCFNEFNIHEKKMLTNAGCDDDGVMCGSENKTTCHKDEESNKWICCCPNNDCNWNTFTPSGINTCNKKDGKQVNCTRNPNTLAFPNHCYNEFDEKNKTLLEAGCDNDDLLCRHKNTTTCYKTMITKKLICCCPNDNCNKKTFTPYGVKKCFKKDEKEEECRRNSSTIAFPKHCFNEFNKITRKLIYAGCDIDNKMCGTRNTTECFEDTKNEKYICCCPNDDCNDKEYHPFPKTVHKCYDTKAKQVECITNTKTCYNMFRNGNLTKAGCATTEMCEDHSKPYCNGSTANTTCCCNFNICNKKTFTPYGVKMCYKKDGKEEYCKRNPATLSFPDHCYNEFDEKENRRIEAGCDNDDVLCGNGNATACYKSKMTNKWICCCPNVDCNKETFTPSRVEKCYKEDGKVENCKRNPITLSLPNHCFNWFDEKENNTLIMGGCDYDDLLCGTINKTICIRNKMKTWLCCCNNDECNSKNFPPFLQPKGVANITDTTVNVNVNMNVFLSIFKAN